MHIPVEMSTNYLKNHVQLTKSDYMYEILTASFGQLQKKVLRASCLMLEFRCYKDENRRSEKAGSCWKSNPGHLCFELPVLCHCMSHNSRTTIYMYCTGGTECLSRTPGQPLPAFLLRYSLHNI